MFLFLLAVAGTALILTQSSIAAPLRDWLSNDKSAWSQSWAKLVSCPMCAGFWIGLAWGTAMLDPTFGMAIFVYGPAGSLASAIGVAIWLLLVEAHGAIALWRYLNQPKE